MSGSAGDEVVALEVIGVGVGVACCGKGLKKVCGGRIVVVEMDEAMPLSNGEGFSRFRSFLVKSDETEELCIVPSVFSVLRIGVSVT
ncbi:hypothetical protein Tco_1350054 [Tanacetum coccineum]